jgi:hypothetical protein
VDWDYATPTRWRFTNGGFNFELGHIYSFGAAAGNELFLSPEQEAEIKKLEEESVKYNRLIREQQIDLQRQKDRLAGNVIKLNVAVMPALIILIGLGLFLNRRAVTRAR